MSVRGFTVRLRDDRAFQGLLNLHVGTDAYGKLKIEATIVDTSGEQVRVPCTIEFR